MKTYQSVNSPGVQSPGFLWKARRALQRLRWRGSKRRNSTHEAAKEKIDIELEKIWEGKSTTNSSVATPLWRAVLRLARPFFCDVETRRKAILLSVGVVACLISESLLIVKYSNVQKNYMTALQEKRSDDFWAGLRSVAVLIVTVIPIIGLHTYIQQCLEIEWRSKVTQSLARGYLGGNSRRPAFYSVHLEGSVDNPDQRICQDAAELVDSSIGLIIDIAGSLFKVIGFVGVLYAISPQACIGILLYIALCTAAGVLGFAPRIFKYQQAITRQEATLRYCLIRVRENAESIAFFGGGRSELARFEHMFITLVDTLYRSNFVKSIFAMFSSIVQMATFCIPALMVAPAYLRGDAEFGAISQAQYAFDMLFKSLMLIMNKLETLSGMAVQVARLTELEEAMQKQSVAQADNAIVADRGTIAMHESCESDGKDEQVLRLSNIKLMTPFRKGCKQHALVENLSLHLIRGQSMLIVGSSGIGKSSLLRGIAGLWTAGSGEVHRIGGAGIFFMPQRPYMYLGTLREQLLYPDVERMDVAPETFQEVLKQVNLGYLVNRYSLHETQEWTHILSLGEQQRVNFARMLLRPALKLALIDEGTSACDPSNEAYLYRLLNGKGYSYVSVGHRPGLREFHSHALYLRQRSVSNSDTLPALGDQLNPASSSSSSRSPWSHGRAEHEDSSSTALVQFMPMKEFEQVGVL